jgi:hypothetical protein
MLALAPRLAKAPYSLSSSLVCTQSSCVPPYMDMLIPSELDYAALNINRGVDIVGCQFGGFETLYRRLVSPILELSIQSLIRPSASDPL